MDYKGVVIEESLENKKVLRKIQIISTKVEKVTPKHKTLWLKQWTLHTIKIPEKKAEQVAENLSQDLETKHHWYADFKNSKYHYIIYRNKIFKVDLTNPILYKDAKKYGISLGIPSYQVDFTPEDKVWKR